MGIFCLFDLSLSIASHADVLKASSLVRQRHAITVMRMRTVGLFRINSKSDICSFGWPSYTSVAVINV